MTRLDVRELRPTDYVWIASRWQAEVVYHQPEPDRADREVTLTATRTRPDRTGLVPSWAWTVCGVLMHYLRWDDDVSPATGRIYISSGRGASMPLRLLNPAVTRPCRRCFPRTESA